MASGSPEAPRCRHAAIGGGNEAPEARAWPNFGVVGEVRRGSTDRQYAKARKAPATMVNCQMLACQDMSVLQSNLATPP